MENNYSIKVAPKAADDLENIFKYISEELYATSSASKILEKIENGIMRLRSFPFSCGYVADEHLMNKGYRKLIIDN